MLFLSAPNYLQLCGLTSFPLCHSCLQVLSCSLSYCTPPYSPSSTVSTAETSSNGPHSAAVVPVDTEPVMGCVTQMAVKTEAPSSSDEACVQKQWMSHLFMPPALRHELPLDSGQQHVICTYICMYCTWHRNLTFSADCQADYPHIFVLCSEVLLADN